MEVRYHIMCVKCGDTRSIKTFISDSDVNQHYFFQNSPTGKPFIWNYY